MCTMQDKISEKSFLQESSYVGPKLSYDDQLHMPWRIMTIILLLHAYTFQLSFYLKMMLPYIFMTFHIWFWSIMSKLGTSSHVFWHGGQNGHKTVSSIWHQISLVILACFIVVYQLINKFQLGYKIHARSWGSYCTLVQYWPYLVSSYRQYRQGGFIQILILRIRMKAW